jgi:formylglycine-generating enzyme required for sulfatase activity
LEYFSFSLSNKPVMTFQNLKFWISFSFIGAFLFLAVSWKFFSQEKFVAYIQPVPDSPQHFGMVPIPGGKFMMGSTQGEADETPVHEVEISSFWMGTHEITWDIFEMFLDKNYEEAISEKPLPDIVDGLSRPSIPYLDMTFGMGKENKPAIGMTQYGAIQFCKWLYLKTGIFYRLPTEAEWEYAAKAGSKSKYFFGDDENMLGEFAWYEKNSGGETQLIGLKKPNPWGLYDILGNVMEWTSDQYDASTYQSRTDILQKDPKISIQKLYPGAIRGGNYKSPAAELRSSKRFYSKADWKRIDPQIPKSQWWFPEAPFLGLRVVRPLHPPSESEIKSYYDRAPIADY